MKLFLAPVYRNASAAFLAPVYRNASAAFLAVAVAAALGLMGLGLAAQDGFSIGGRISATDQEAQEGYFAIDQQTMIVVKPNSDLHNYLKGKVGQKVRVTVAPDRESE